MYRWWLPKCAPRLISGLDGVDCFWLILNASCRVSLCNFGFEAWYYLILPWLRLFILYLWLAGIRQPKGLDIEGVERTSWTKECSKKHVEGSCVQRALWLFAE